MSPAKGKARLDLLLVIVLAALPLVPALAPGRTLYYRDIGQYYLPNRALTVDAIHDGRLPRWNPQRNSGQPFLANPNCFVLRPTTLLFLPFPARLVHIPMTLSIMFLLACAAAGTWLLLRDSGLSRPACLLGASAFALSGGVQSMGQVLNHLEGVAYIPVTLWAVRRSLVRGWRPWGVIAGALFGLVVSAGEPVWIVVTCLAACALPGLSKLELRAAARTGAVVLLLGLAVSAAQLFPLLENAARSERGAGLSTDDSMRWSLAPQGLLQSAIPGFWGDTS
ncbi:MAG TPA: hypothetical protein VE404_08980, partial [Verrucomicrobiae bacterium]|nr:hypothetical protein [Verrucomicrobiae bacterium]